MTVAGPSTPNVEHIEEEVAAGVEEEPTPTLKRGLEEDVDEPATTTTPEPKRRRISNTSLFEIESPAGASPLNSEPGTIGGIEILNRAKEILSASKEILASTPPSRTSSRQNSTATPPAPPPPAPAPEPETAGLKLIPGEWDEEAYQRSLLPPGSVPAPAQTPPNVETEPAEAEFVEDPLLKEMMLKVDKLDGKLDRLINTWELILKELKKAGEDGMERILEVDFAREV